MAIFNSMLLVFYEGCFFLTFTTGKAAADALKCFSLTRLEGTQPELLLLPYIHVVSQLREAWI